MRRLLAKEAFGNQFGFQLAVVLVNDAVTREAITDDVAQMFQAIIEDRNAPKVEKSIDGYSGSNECVHTYRIR